MQSHIAESIDEEAFVESLYPGKRDTAIFDEAGLLTDRCIMAHGVHLQPEEMDLISTRRSGIACCPLSNAFFAGGEFQMVEAQRHNVRVGLGTDVAGGYSPSLLVNCRRGAEQAARTKGRECGIDKRAFWTATLGGARALGLEDHLGSFAVGKQFDACVIAGGCGVYELLSSTRAQVQQASASSSSSGKRKAPGRRGGRLVARGRIRAMGQSWDDRNCRRVYVRGASCTSRICERDVCL